jgi:uncharacterized membrane protein
MDKKLFSQAIIKHLSGLVLISALLFIPARTLKFWNAWLFIAVLFIPMLLMGISFGDQKPRAFAQKAKRKRERGGAKRAW